MRKFKAILLSCAAAVVGFVGYSAITGGTIFAAETAECGANSIITCGAMSSDQLKAKYAANENDLQAIYAHYGITAADVANSTNVKTGYVNPDGTITVDGKVVATGAISVGRTNETGSTAVKIGGSTVYQGSGRVHSPLSAFIFTDANGTFKAAIIKVCGNPVIGTPVVVKKPVYTCDSLTASADKNKVTFTTKATAKDGATITGYAYDFGDSTAVLKTNTATASHSYSKAGTYTAKITVSFNVEGADTASQTDACTVSVTIAPVMVSACNIETGVVGPVDESKIDNVKYTTDSSKCTKVEYCDTTTKTHVTVTEANKKPSYTTDMSKCKTTVCRLSDKTVVSIEDADYQKDKTAHTTNLDKCKDEPVVVTQTPTPKPTPTPVATTPAPAPVVQLPQTGPVDAIGSGLGLGALTLAGYYYFTSRKML